MVIPKQAHFKFRVLKGKKKKNTLRWAVKEGLRRCAWGSRQWTPEHAQ